MRKHIVFVLTNYIGGGQEQCFNKTASALLQNDMNIQIYLYVIDRFTKKEQVPTGVKIIKNLKELISLKKWRGRFICVNYSSDWKSSLISVLISRKYISWIHSNPLVMATARTRKINFFLIRCSYRIVCVCHEQEELLHDVYGFDKTKLLTIYNCVDLADINIKKRESLDIKYKYILMVARFDFASKDYPTLLEAYSCLDESIRKKYKLVLLGDGPDECAIKIAIKKLKLDEYVIMPGYDPNPFKWMAKASLFMLISKTEGFALTVIEAMACGIPVLITKYHTGAQEVSQNGKNCFIVNMEDATELAKVITKMLINKELVSKLTENASLFVEKFDYKNFARNINNFFNSL